MRDLEFRIFPSNPQPMIQNCNFVATFWSVFNIMKLKHPRTAADQQQENTDLFACSIILQIALLFLVHIVLVFLFGTNFTQLENNFLTNCSLQSPDSLSQPAAMSQTGKINLITCARLHLPAWASVMLGFDSFQQNSIKLEILEFLEFS